MTGGGDEAQLEKPPTPPSLAQALGLLVFALFFAVLMWWEHVWRLGRGDYPGLGLRHTWYWHTTVWTAWVVLVGRVLWILRRWWRD